MAEPEAPNLNAVRLELERSGANPLFYHQRGTKAGTINISGYVNAGDG